MKRTAMWILAVMMVFGCGALAAQDKDAPKEKDTSKAVSEESVSYYKLEFTLQEFDGAKLVNRRVYTMNVRADKGNWEQLRTGSRVPLPFEDQGGKHVNYFDVGVNLDCRGVDTSKGLSLEVRSDISSLPADAPTSYAPGQGPMVRQVKSDSWVLLQSGKSANLFTADEPATSRRFEMEVKATKF